MLIMNKKSLIYLSSLFFSFGFLSSQDFDESFLASLPNDVREQLLNQVQDSKDSEGPVYRPRASSIKQNSGPPTRFGDEFFSNIQTTMMPVNETNFDDSYILDYGDVLELQLVGQENTISELIIKRDGSVNLPQIGKAFIAGLSLLEATKLIKSRFANSYIGIEAFISLVSIRDIQVIVSGNAKFPGQYTLNGNSNIFHALSVSGGPSTTGSFRRIDLIRKDKVIESIDLYDMFIFGKSSFGQRLRSGDIVFIQPIENLVSVSGGVNRPNKYELLESENLDKLIIFSNGISVNFDKDDISLFRIENKKVNKIKIKDLQTLERIIPRDKDHLFFGQALIKEVEIEGAVKNPGKYLVNEGESLSGIIEKAGGYNANAYPFGGILINKVAFEVSRQASEDLYKDLQNYVATSGISAASNDGAAEAIELVFNMLSNAEPNGRIIAEFDLNKIASDPNLDTQLQNEDLIIIPEITNQVYVFGEVQNEGPQRIDSDEDFSWYIESSGGFREYADKSRIYILSPNGMSVRASKNIFDSNPKNIEIYPGSVIYVPRKLPRNLQTLQLSQAYATILGNLGISLASISVLKDW